MLLLTSLVDGAQEADFVLIVGEFVRSGRSFGIQ